MTLLFVYGTLKQGLSNHAYLAGQKLLGPARTQPGYRLFEVGGYPGMVPWPSDRVGVTGEVWEVDDQALAELDAFEGVPEGLYRRECVPLQAPFTDARVDAYIYPHSVAGRTEIGDSWKE